MNIRDDDQVSAVALVVESEAETAARVADGGPVSVADDNVPAAADLADELAEDPLATPLRPGPQRPTTRLAAPAKRPMTGGGRRHSGR